MNYKPMSRLAISLVLESMSATESVKTYMRTQKFLNLGPPVKGPRLKAGLVNADII